MSRQWAVLQGRWEPVLCHLNWDGQIRIRWSKRAMQSTGRNQVCSTLWKGTIPPCNSVKNRHWGGECVKCLHMKRTQTTAFKPLAGGRWSASKAISWRLVQRYEIREALGFCYLSVSLSTGSCSLAPHFPPSLSASLFSAFPCASCRSLL